MKWLKELSEDAYHYGSYDVPVDDNGYPNPNLPYRQPTHIGYMLIVLGERIRYQYNTWLCKYWYKDHDIEYEFSIGPDSGSESMYCKRCHWSWEHTYY